MLCDWDPNRWVTLMCAGGQVTPSRGSRGSTIDDFDQAKLSMHVRMCLGILLELIFELFENERLTSTE